MSLKSVIKVFYPFNGGATYGATVDANGWKGQIVKSAGSPTVANVGDGGVALATDVTSEIQSAALTNGDVLSYPFSTMDRYRFEAKGSVSSTHSTFALGLGSALNTSYTGMTNYIFFLSTGSTINIAASDGVNVYSAIPTGVALGTTPASFQYFGIDFTQGLSDVRFYIDNGQSFRRVAAATTFNLSNAAGNYFQPVFFTVKSSSTDLSAATVRNLEIEYRAN